VNIADTLNEMAVADLDLSRHVTVSTVDSVRETVGRMNDARLSSAFVVDGDNLVGIFTQRDVVSRVLGVEGICDVPIGEVMTPAPRTVTSAASVNEAMAIMTELWTRSVPVVDDGAIRGNFSFYTAMRVIADLLARKASRDESDLAAQHGLMFVDFTGLHTAPAVTVGLDESVETAVHHMNARALGSVLVVNARESLAGVLTEFDLQTKVACTGTQLADVTVSEVMTAEPISISVRSPIADAVVQMAEHEMSHVALVAETGRPLGVATFRDVADYYETSLQTLISPA
jgi:signal-transduction protein with cAMP-binding, CBS, and nucleotidyltransferase domain